MQRWITRTVVVALVAGGAAYLLLEKPWVKGPTPITYTGACQRWASRPARR